MTTKAASRDPAAASPLASSMRRLAARLALVLLAAIFSRDVLAQRVLVDRADRELSRVTDDAARLRLLAERAHALLVAHVPSTIEAGRALSRAAREQGREDWNAIGLMLEARGVLKTRGRAAALVLVRESIEVMPEDCEPEVHALHALLEAEFRYTIDEYHIAAQRLGEVLNIVERRDLPGMEGHAVILFLDLLGATGLGYEPTEDLDRAEALFRRAGEDASVLRVEARRISVLLDEGRENEGLALSDAVAREARRVGDRRAFANARLAVLNHAWTVEDYEEASGASRDLLANALELEDREFVADAYDGLAWSALMAGRNAEAREHLEKALAAIEGLGLRESEMSIVDTARELARRDGDAEGERSFSDRLAALHGDDVNGSAAIANRELARSFLRELRRERVARHRDARRVEARLREAMAESERRVSVYRWALGAALAVGALAILGVIRAGRRRSRREARRHQLELEEMRRRDENRIALDERSQRTERLDGMGLLAAGVAHDFNNLLCAISGSAESLRDRDPDAREDADTILDAAERAAALCRQMMDQARHVPRDARVADLREVARRVARFLGENGGTVGLSLDLPDRPVCARIDAMGIEQVLINLVTNAREACEEGGLVTIHVRSELASRLSASGAAWFGATHLTEELAVIAVLDDGRGMDAETLRRAFDPFYSTKAEGRGLGLAAACGIVRSHGGAIAVDSVPGRGSRFSVLLPRCEETTAPPEPRRDDAPAAAARAGRLLVADDEPHLRRLVSRAFEGRGWTVDVVADGDEAVTRIERGDAPYDAILVNLSMPGVDGADVLRRIAFRHPGIATVITSGHADASVQARLQGVAVGAFLPKPFSLPQLFAAVDSAIAARTQDA
ncbi:MAG: response regulator [Planctomycetota bacterium]